MTANSGVVYLYHPYLEIGNMSGAIVINTDVNDEFGSSILQMV
jgi:hypothetical protein